MKKLLIAIGVLSVVAGIWTGLSAQSNPGTTRNCTGNAVIRCGTFNQSEMNSRLTASSRAVFSHFGISTNLSGAKNGTLKANGDVVVDGKVVATGAQSVGRGTKAGAKPLKIGGQNFYQHSARSAFLGYDTPVFVFFNSDGTFKNAIAKICGNPIIATPKPKPKPTPKYSCDNLAVTKISRTSFRFSSSYTAQNATYRSTTYVVRNASNRVVQNSTSNTFTTSTPGKYTVEARVTFVVDGQTKTVTGPKCKKEFTVEPAPVKKIEVCELDSKKVITIDEKDFDPKKHSKDLEDCKEEPIVKIKVCELETKKIITIDEKDFDSERHSRSLEDCKEVPVEPPVEPPVTPEPPVELPRTGLGDNILVSGLGLGSLVAATIYYAASRRNLLGQ